MFTKLNPPPTVPILDFNCTLRYRHAHRTVRAAGAGELVGVKGDIIRPQCPVMRYAYVYRGQSGESYQCSAAMYIFFRASTTQV